MGFPLHHTKQAPVDHLEGVGLQGGEHEKQPIFRRRQGAVFVHGKPTSDPRLSIHPPRRHPGVERGLEGRDQLLKLLKRHTREIQELQRARLQLGKPYMESKDGALLPFNSRFPPSAPHTGQVAFTTSGVPTPAVLIHFRTLHGFWFREHIALPPAF